MIDRTFLLRAASALIAAPSENPPDDTREAADAACALLRAIPGVEVTVHTKVEPVRNVVAVLRGARPGRRLVLSGHLDTFPAGDAGRWSVPPFEATIRGDRLYGRGAADMKGGIAAAIAVLGALAQTRDFAGELVIALAGDEESMGISGTQFLLDTVPAARGDLAIVPDAGSPAVIRFGEKGMVWLDLAAEGRAAHGAHVHRYEVEPRRVGFAQIRRHEEGRHPRGRPERGEVAAVEPRERELDEREVVRHARLAQQVQHRGRFVAAAGNEDALSGAQ